MPPPPGFTISVVMDRSDEKISLPAVIVVELNASVSG
jgi:hypothetical protein